MTIAPPVILPILQEPDPRLRQISQPVDCVNDTVHILVHNMMHTMDYHGGIGLAAPQVDVRWRVIVMKIQDKTWRMINPEIVWASEHTVSLEEGCLSIEGDVGRVWRPACVRVRYQDLAGHMRQEELVDLPAVCVQHEIDHLDGILFVDRLSSVTRKLVMQRRTKRLAVARA